MQYQSKYHFIYLTFLWLFIGSAIEPAQAREPINADNADTIQLDQAQLDQILAPIALYPDTLLSHILVASTYPLEVVQAARWRAVNKDLDEQQALNAVENKAWDPSVQALVPFNDLLQTLSDDLDWLQDLGSAFLVNEERVLASVQNLRQKAYQQGNLTNNDYIHVEQQSDEIIIETVRKEVVYVPYYDTRVVYGNWWWNDYQPIFWHRPRHYVYNSGFYWSVGFNTRPSFYFGGFHWRNRHVVVNYDYRRYANRHWTNNRQVVRVTEYPRWRHNQHHRRGVQYRINNQNITQHVRAKNNIKVRNSHYRKQDKQRVLNANDYAKKSHQSKARQIKQRLHKHSTASHQTQKHGTQNNKRDKQFIAQSQPSPAKQRQKIDTFDRSINPSKRNKAPMSNARPQKYAAKRPQAQHKQRTLANPSSKSKTYHSNNNNKGSPANSKSLNKAKSVKTHRQNKARYSN